MAIDEARHMCIGFFLKNVTANKINLTCGDRWEVSS